MPNCQKQITTNCIKSVSYTHLDVYKRQTHRCNDTRVRRTHNIYIIKETTSFMRYNIYATLDAKHYIYNRFNFFDTDHQQVEQLTKKELHSPSLHFVTTTLDLFSKKFSSHSFFVKGRILFSLAQTWPNN